MPERNIGGFGVVDLEWHEITQPATKALSNKARKSKEVVRLHTLLTQCSSWLIFAGIKPEQVSNYALEAWSLKHIRETSVWLETVLVPSIKSLEEFIDRFQPEYWKKLFDFNPNHGDLKTLNGYKDIVRRTWWVRPRFKMEKLRVKEEGY